MKPYYGGVLLQKEGAPTGITPAQCLHYVLSQPVATTVPGSRSADQMRQTLSYLVASAEEKQATPLGLDLKHWLRGQCVRCKHCLPCPQDIDIPGVIYYLNYVEYYGLTPFHQEFNRKGYFALAANGSDCIECEVCVERCPFEVDIVGKMQRAVAVFGSVI
jgi:predicted aldo/keto reductase-like oxidoreductase